MLHRLLVKIRHIVPNRTLLDIYKSLIAPYITYELTSWGNASKTLLNKVLVLQKRALRLIYFAQARDHAIPFSWKVIFYQLNFYDMRKLLTCCTISTLILHQLISWIYSLKLTKFILTAHAHQHLNIILLNNPYLKFKVRPFCMLPLKSSMGYQQLSNTYPKTLLKRSLRQN